MASGPPLIGIVGWKNSGKTTLIEHLVAALTQRGLKVATVKHTHHELRARDGATDGERHAQAGAIQGPADIVLVEGFKSAAIPKIEVRRLASRTHDPLAASDPHVIAIAADHAVEAATVPVFALDDIEAIAAFIVASTGLKSA